MHILIITQYFWPENFRINDLALGLIERGHEVTVLTGIPNYPEGRFFPGYGIFRNLRQKYFGAKVLRVPLVPRGNGSGLQLVLNYLSFVVSASLLALFLGRTQIDLIFVCQLSPVTVGLPALLLKKLKKIPIIFWILDLWPESLSATGAVRSQKALALIEKLAQWVYQGCDKIVVASKGFIPSLRTKGVETERTDFFPNWYEPEYCFDNIYTEEVVHNKLPRGFRVMFAGNIGVAQDFGTILAAAEKLREYPDIHWVVIGDGRRYNWVMQQITLRGLSNTMHLLGRYPSKAMPGFFSQADVMLVTLKRDPIFALTVPGKIQSYMACGRPIIAALDGEGGKLVSESGAGLSSPSEDVEALAKSVLAMYRMPQEQREEMGRLGKKYCEMNFEREMLIDQLERWMWELV